MLAPPKSAIPRILNPLDWSVDRPPRRQKIEGQDLYRQIGVAPDVDFEEVKAAIEDLKVKYAKDPKRCIKLEVVQDKIMELRLRQASAGKLAMKGSALEMDNLIRSNDELKAKRAKQFKAPKWTRGLVRPVTRKVAIQYAKVMGVMFFVGGVFAPGFGGVIGFFTMLTGANNLYRRGRPKQFVEEGMPPTQDFPNMAQTKKIAGITAMFVILAIGVNEGIVSKLVIPTLLEGKFAKDRCLCACFTVASYAMSCMFYIYGPKKEGKKKK